MRVLMLVQSSVAGDSRVLRQAGALVEAGHEVHIVGRSVPDAFVPDPGISVRSVAKSRGMRLRAPGRGGAGRPTGAAATPPPAAAGSTARPAVPTAPGGLSLRSRALRVARWLLLPEHRDRTERQWRADAGRVLAPGEVFDVVHAHDFNTLELGVDLSRRWGSPLVYDAHELWFGRGLPGRPTPLWQARGYRREARLAAHATVVLTVSEGIADRLRGRGLTDVRVVRNTFPLAGHVEPELPEQPTGLAYAGRIGAGRDLEAVVGAARALAPLRTVLAGPADRAYRFDPGGVEVLPSMSLDRVDELYRDVGIAIVTLTDSCDNHRLALPNKLFHAVRAGVPVVAADLPELRAVVVGHGLGELYTPGDAASLAQAVRTVAAGYPTYAEAVRAARPDLAWEHDARVLTAAYAELEAA